MDQQLPLEIDVHTAKRMLDGNERLLLLDCREPLEVQLAQISGGISIPMQQIPQRIAELTDYRDHSILVYCHHGFRSFQVVCWLRNQGFAEAQSISGGIDAWSQQIDPQLPRY